MVYRACGSIGLFRCPPSTSRPMRTLQESESSEKNDSTPCLNMDVLKLHSVWAARVYVVGPHSVHGRWRPQEISALESLVVLPLKSCVSSLTDGRLTNLLVSVPPPVNVTHVAAVPIRSVQIKMHYSYLHFNCHQSVCHYKVKMKYCLLAPYLCTTQYFVWLSRTM